MKATSFNLPKNTAPAKLALPPAERGSLAVSIKQMMAQHPELTGIKPLTSGAEAFATRMFLADAAVSSLDVQYYIWRDDLTGHLLLERLQQAAARGVRVRLLLDDHGTANLDQVLMQLHQQPNFEVRLWNPFNLRKFKKLSFAFDFFRLNRRMHNKSFTIDGRASVLGGRNIGDEYFSTGATPLSVDLDVIAVGAVVPHISADFDRYWNSPSAYPADLVIKKSSATSNPLKKRLACYHNTRQMAEYSQVLDRTQIVDRLAAGQLDLEWAPAKLVSDDPAKGQGALPREELLGGLLLAAVGTIEERFDGVSPYFVPGKEGVKAFNYLTSQGVQVRILTNSLEATNVLPVHAGYAKRRHKMLAGGVQLYEMRSLVKDGDKGDKVSSRLGLIGSSGSSLHAKTFAVDGKRIFVGSFNFDPRSDRLNTEMGLLISSENLAQMLHSAFDNQLFGTSWLVQKHGRQLSWTDPSTPEEPPLTREPGSSLLRSISLKIIGWLPVEWLL